MDIEGLAVRDGYLYVGFRGPILRENWVPVLKCQFATPITEAELMYVNLNRQGFRLEAGSIALREIDFWVGE